MADEQRLNSLERFRKRPGRLVLEEHGHCEVPAGCGGVVLRWRNPRAPLPVTVRLYTAVDVPYFIDGVEHHLGRIDLAPGPHAFAVALAGVDLSAGLLMFTASHDPKEYQRDPPSGVEERPLQILSADDGTWKFSLDAPAGEEWKSLTFDDRAWPALIGVPTPNLEWEDHGCYEVRVCADKGAACLGLPQPPEGEEKPSWWRRLFRGGVPHDTSRQTIWIRKVFEVPAPREHNP